MLRHIGMQHLAPTMFQYDKYEKYLHREHRHSKEVNRYRVPDMVAQESLPGLVRRPAELSQKAGYVALRDLGARHDGFAAAICSINRRSPGGTGTTSTTATRDRQPRLEPSEPFTLPSNDRVCLDVHQGTSPIGPQAAKRNPKHPVKGRQNRALLSSLKCRYLHSERCVLDGNDLMAAEEQSEESKHQQ